MMIRKIELEKRPNYSHGQLLLEDDFLDEQHFHLAARLRHNRWLHGWGVVKGLEVFGDGRSLTVQPGCAIDRQGHEIVLHKAQTLELSGFGPNQVVRVGLSYQEEQGQEGVEDKRRPCYAVLSLDAPDTEEVVVVLATVQLDDKAQVGPAALDYSHTDYAQAALGRGTVTAVELAPELSAGWLRLPFRAIALTNIPEGEDEIPPGFRIGATEARSPSPGQGAPDKGAAGTMAIPIPPSVRRATRFRIAGEQNDGELHFSLVAGGWDPDKNEHYRRTVKEDTIAKAPYFETYALEGDVDPEFHTLSLWVRSTRRASVSLVAVEFAF